MVACLGERGRPPNEGMHLTRSALPTTEAALAGDPWCSAGNDAAGGVTPWGSA